MIFRRKTPPLPDTDAALPGRPEPMAVSGVHFVNGTSIVPPFPDGMEVVIFGMGCFWGAERVFWQIPGVHTTAAGYAGGSTQNPTYDEVCSGRTGHTEAVLVVYDPKEVSFAQLMKVFWEEHDPTQGMRQGNDTGTQYRSAVYWSTDEQRAVIETSKASFEAGLRDAGYGPITTEIGEAGPWFYAEEYHQQYLAKNLVGAGVVTPDQLEEWYLTEAPAHPLAVEGYCSMRGTGVACPIGLNVDLGGD